MGQGYTSKGRSLVLPVSYTEKPEYIREMKIYIDFPIGAYGNFFEFFLNKTLLGDAISQETPFTPIGTSHIKTSEYFKNRVVSAMHYTFLGHRFTDQNIISIRYDDTDLLSLMTVGFLRQGDLNIDSDSLDTDTYHKLVTKRYFSVLDSLNQNYNLSLSPENPDCPRHILREFYKFGFKNTKENGHMKELADMVYNPKCRVYNFNYKSFYSKKLFFQELSNLLEFFDLKSVYNGENLYDQFNQRILHFSKLKPYCDDIVDAVSLQCEKEITNLSLFQESYINAQIENKFDCEMPFLQNIYFKNTKEIISYINEI